MNVKFKDSSLVEHYTRWLLNSHHYFRKAYAFTDVVKQSMASWTMCLLIRRNITEEVNLNKAC